MSIGCYDADIQKYIHVPFNLELMKLSSYYKKKGQIVSLAPCFTPERYTKFFYRKDYQDGDFNKRIFSEKNVIWGGQAFSGDKYIPLDLAIEEQKPDIYLYSSKKDFFGNNLKYQNMFKILENGTHLRLSLDNNSIWDNYHKQISQKKITNLFVYDFNLNSIKGAYELLDDLTQEKLITRRISIGNKFPIQVDNEEDLLKWCSLQPSQNFFSIQYNGIMSDNTLNNFILLCKDNTLSAARQLDYVVTANCNDKQDFIDNKLVDIFLQICFLRMNGIKISLKYEDGFFLDNNYEKFLELLNCYLSGFIRFNQEKRDKMIKFDTLYSFCHSFSEFRRYKERIIFTKEEAREIFNFIAENNYKLFRLFYECSDVRLENGRLIPV